MKAYKAGFTVNGKEPYETEEWIYSEEYSNDNKIVFLGYDANLMAMPNLSERFINDYNKKWFEKQKRKALMFTKDFKGEVWLDDIKIKALEGDIHGKR